MVRYRRPLGVRHAEIGDALGIDVVADAVAVVAHRVGLDAQPGLEELADIGQGDGVYEYALLGVYGQKLLLLQATDGVAHGRAAGLQALAQRLLGQLGPGQDLAAHDLPLQILVDDLFQARRGLCRLGFHVLPSPALLSVIIIILLYTINVNRENGISENIF